MEKKQFDNQLEVTPSVSLNGSGTVYTLLESTQWKVYPLFHTYSAGPFFVFFFQNVIVSAHASMLSPDNAFLCMAFRAITFFNLQ